MKPLFVKFTYERQSGFVILIRNGHVYKQSDRYDQFSPINIYAGHNCISFKDVAENDSILIFNDEKAFCNYMLAATNIYPVTVIRQFKFKNKNMLVKDVVDALNSGKFVGYKISHGTLKYVIKADGIDSIKFYRNGKEESRWSDTEHYGICKGVEDCFLEFDNEYELYKWALN